MASKRSEVAQLNNILSEYLERLSVSEEAKRGFLSKADSMLQLDSHRSLWFHSFTAQLSQILHQIQQPRPEIDLNEPAASQDNEVEEPSDMHNNEVSLILLSDSD